MSNNSDKGTRNLNVPTLRFPEFEGEWEKTKLSNYSSKITKKNKGNQCKNVLCNSASLGIIPQKDYFDREIANGDNTDGYYVISNGDFIYNPRKSSSAPYGPINIYEGVDTGIISPLYLCFSVKNIYKKFLLFFFKSSAWYSYVYKNGDSGVRHDRVSIKDEVFLSMPIPIPLKNEQKKIADFLSLIDQRIYTQNKIIESLESLIKGLSEKLTKQSSPNTEIGDSLTCKSSTLQESLISTKGKYPVYGASGICGFVDVADVHNDSILIIKDGASVGTTYLGYGQHAFIGTLNSLTQRNGYSLEYLYYALKVFNFAPYKTGLAIPHIYFKDYSKAKIWCPKYDEQVKIAKTLSAIDKKIQIEKSLLEQLNSQKRFLLSQMFI